MSEQRTVQDEIAFIRSCLNVLDEDLAREDNGVMPIMSPSGRLCPVLNGKEALRRLEAAYERELGELSKQIGNAAKLREAVGKAIDKMRETVDCLDIPDDYFQTEIQQLHTALAAPARNCEVGTPEEQADRFQKFCLSRTQPWHGCDGTCPLLMSEKCALAWAQMPYKAEEEKEGAEK